MQGKAANIISVLIYMGGVKCSNSAFCNNSILDPFTENKSLWMDFLF